MKKLTLLAILFTAAGVLAAGPWGLSRGPWWQTEEAVAALGLSPDQQARLDKLMFEHRSQAIDLRAALEKAELRLREIMNEARFDERAALEQIDRVVAARSQMEKHRAVLLVKTRAILTPEQWAKAKERLLERGREMRQERREERRERREERRERRGDREPAPPCPNALPPDEF